MTFVPFGLEAWQSEWERRVAINLADSGVHPVTARDLLEAGADVEALLATPLDYPHVNGTPALRERIAALYPGATAANVLVTVGAAEANTVALQTLVAPGDRAVTIEPCYRQLWGSVRNLGGTVESVHLDPARGWRLDLAALEAAARRPARVIGVTNPVNPTGTILDATERGALVAAAARHGATLLADEVYRGTERLTDVETPSFWGAYENVVAVGGLSKAYGLPGLRIGWVVAPEPLVAEIWRRHEYVAIAAASLSMALAERALAEPVRSRLLARGRAHIRAGWSLVAGWIARRGGLVDAVPPEATALAFVRYRPDVPSLDVAHRLRERAGVLVAPGDLFGVEKHFRLAHGLPESVVREALERIGDVLASL